MEKVEDAVVNSIKQDRASGIKNAYIFDSFPLHSSASDFFNFTKTKLNSASPDYVFDLREGSGVDLQMSIARFKKRGELEEVTEDQQNELKGGFASWNDKIQAYVEEFLGD